ncbi:PHD and RING finger domain-containing protein like [Verticillium longisporum]|uniref:PHD and RING finger domain-containing protein like n=1 Tax=Verticillium longisporum TaxID=100787 RepID=A0A8I2ZJN1_VERLO|nr:PHD and RING finger domain-containing protein like [Verticillium longisporum]
MTDPDQCIICLESLQPPPTGGDSTQPAAGGPSATASASKPSGASERAVEPATPIKVDPELLESDENHLIATLVGCNHIVHDRCIRSWAKNSNTCPICRTTFNEISLSAELDGPEIDLYSVEDKKQTHEFDLRQWLQENPEEEEPEEETPCPICGMAERPDILLLCDGCDAAYHTHCVGLNHVPAGSWYCLECVDIFRPAAASDSTSDSDVQAIAPSTNHRRPFVRTRERQRRARRQARSVEWQGAWGQIAGRIFEATDIDLDNYEDDDSLEGFRRTQQQRERESREYREWEQRLQIASRQGAGETFARSIPRAIGERLDIVQPVQETAEERLAWGALDRARQSANNNSSSSHRTVTPNRRKRKPRSASTSPREAAAAAAEEPERKLKRPRTRRLPIQGEASGSGTSGPAAAVAAAPVPAPAPAPPSATSPTDPSNSAASAARDHPLPINGSSSTSVPTRGITTAPSFLSSLLKEVEMSTPSDEENARSFFNSHNGVDASSPPTSPSPPSSRNSPRALSLTPPPLPRPTSPSSLSSYVEPVYPKANYSPNRQAGDTSDSESRARQHRHTHSDIRQPRPRRPGQLHRSPTRPRSQVVSPASDLSREEKERVSAFVKSALKPHWDIEDRKITAEQYSNINRDVSRKLYDGLRDPAMAEDKAQWEARAKEEVTRAVAALQQAIPA